MLPSFKTMGSAHPKAHLENIGFRSEYYLYSWKKTFADPMIPPEHHARAVEYDPGDTEESSWILGFPR